MKNFRVVAAIDVGSNFLQMKIAQITSQGEITILEDLLQPTDIGRDTFTTGRIEQQTSQATSTVLKGFARVMKDYRVKYYRAVSTSGIREAENREYILELIRLNAKINVEVINSAQERFFIYKAMRNYFLEPALTFTEATLVVNMASGGLETSIYKNGNLKLTEYIKIGSLRLRETLADLETRTVNFPSIMEEFIESKLHLLKPTILKEKIVNFVILGGEARSIVDICQKNHFIERKTVTQLYETLYRMSDEQIARNYKLSPNQAETFLPSVIILHCFLEMTLAERIFAPEVSLKDGLLLDIADQLYETPRKRESLNDIISSVWYIANKFGVDKQHAQQVEKLALSIFDLTWKYHRLEERERLLLQVAAILHAIGYYINFSDHHIHAYTMIKTQNIMGFSDRELNLIANIVRYHAHETPGHLQLGYASLSDNDKIIVSKLAAILKLAECLDVSHLSKVEKVELSLAGDELIFNVFANEDTFLEEWYFLNNSRLFEEVTGIKSSIKRKG